MMKGDVNFHSNKKDPAPHTMDDQAELRSLHFSFYPCVRIDSLTTVLERWDGKSGDVPTIML